MKDCSCQNPIRTDEYVVAMAYVPWQNFEALQDDLEKAFHNGTIFPSLDKPFTGRRCE